MATLLYRLGRASFRRAWLVLVAWIIVLGTFLGGGVALGGQLADDFTIPGTEAQEALDQLDALFPETSGASVQAVVEAPEGELVTDDAVRDQLDDLQSALADVDGVVSTLGPFEEFASNQVSDDERVAIIQVQFDAPSVDITEEQIAEVLATADDIDSRVEFAGQVFQDTSVGVTITEVFGVLFAAAVLLITFGSIRPAWMPLATALVGVGIAMGGILGVAYLTPVSASAPLLALMIGLAVGIDYALFIVSRHRAQLARGETPEQSAATAVGTAGSAVVFAGITVIIALLGLLVVGIPFLSVMGIGAAFAVLVAIAAAVTLLPAFFRFAGASLAPKEGSRAWKRAHPTAAAKPTMGRRWVRGVMRRPVLASLGVVALLGGLSVPAFSLDLNLPDGGREPAGSTQREAYDLIADAFGPGTAGPLLVTLDITQTTDILDDLEAIAAELEQVDGVESVGRGIPSPGLDLAIIRVIPETAPDDPVTKQLVADLRALSSDIEAEFDTPMAVTGTTAISIDISNRLSNALVPFGLVVVGLSVVLLMMVFRSVLVPLKAAAGFLLTVGTALGVTVAVFQWGWGAEALHVEAGPILSFMPIILMAVLFGLAMDYEVFLVSGMREQYVHGRSARDAIEEGFADGARVVTAAAMIMFFVFAAFVPEGAGIIKPIALGLAIGIAVDAVLVRMTLGPALMTLFGRSAWWFPRWLDRSLPDLDVEGEQLRRHRELDEWALQHRGHVLVAEALEISGVDAHLDVVADPGDRVVLIGAPEQRRLAAATLAGYLPAAGGRAVVAGALLPVEPTRASRRVALVDVSGDRLGPALTLGELVTERLALARGRVRQSQRARRWLARLAATVGALGIEPGALADPSTPVALLDPQRRALALAAVATIDGAPVMVFDHRDDVLDAGDAALIDELVLRLAPERTVRVWGRGSLDLDGGGVVALLRPNPVTVPADLAVVAATTEEDRS